MHRCVADSAWEETQALNGTVFIEEKRRNRATRQPKVTQMSAT
jgi:hypothetical protein